tara:strand:- start:1700 stop:1921 length:222 start_codon:yes stop_codon:yes gene_type:complete
MSNEEKEDYLIDKIIEHVQSGILNDKKDLKLYGIEDHKLQKDLMWGILENQLLTNDSPNKSDIIRKFYRSNLM